MRKAARWIAGLVMAAWIILLTAWLTLHWGIFPRIDEWRPQIEQRAAAALGVPLRIGRIEIESRGWVPSFELREVVVSDARGREALRLPRVAATVSTRSLLALQARFKQLLIDAPEIEIRRDANGRLLVAGIDFGVPHDASAADGAAADWFLAQPEVIVRGGVVRWVDESRDNAALQLRDVSLVLRNGVRRHEIRVDATPPDEWGERFSFAGRFTQPLLSRASDFARWRGTMHAELPRLDVRELRRHASLPFDLEHGRGALRAWVEIGASAARRVTLDLALAGVSMRMHPALQRIRFAQIEGRVVVDRDDGGTTWSAERFGFVDDAGVAWPQGSLKLVLRERPGEAPAGGSFEADRLDLALIAGLAGRVPLGASLHKLLGELAPRGVVHDLKARWDGSLDAPDRYQAKARMTGLALAAKPAAAAGAIGRPGVANADIEFNASERGGEANLSMSPGTLDVPGVFEQSQVRLQLSAQLGWRIDAARPGAAAPPQVDVRVSRLRFQNADARGELSAKWSTGPGSGFARGARYPGVLELDGTIERGLAASVARYLPLGLPEDVRRYVQRAVKGGSVGPATFRVKGDLWDFPFRDARQGEFRIAGRVNDGVFDYVPSVAASAREPAYVSPWPGLTRLAGELVFDRMSMQFRDARARLGDFELSRTSGGIRDFDDPVVVVEGSGTGALDGALRFVGTTPVGDWTGGALARATASGGAELKLALRMPLADLDRTTVQGSIALAGNDLRIRPDAPLLASARGRIDFTHDGFSISGGAAQVLGGDATFEGGAQPDGTLRFTGQGVATAEGLRRARELGAFVPLVARHLTGQAPYRVTLAFGEGDADVLVTSSLLGVASDLPAPLGKRAEAPLALRLHVGQAPDSKPGAPRDRLRFELGNAVQAHFTRDTKGEVARVLRGGIGVGDAAPEPESGVHANASVASLDIDAWRAVLERLDAGVPPAAAGVGSAARAPAPGAAADGGYAPSRIALRAAEVVAEGRKLTRLVAGLSQLDGVWRANLDADQLDGYAEWQPSSAGAGRVYARLARLALPQAEAQSLAAQLDTQQPAAAPPALDVVVDDFELRGKKLGRLEIRAAHRGPPARREWLLDHLAVKTPEAQLYASGHWLAAAQRRSQIDFMLDLQDSGAYLERLGFGRPVRGGKGRLQGHVAWPGSPLAFDPARLDGEINIDIQGGQFLKVEPGAARLLGVLSLQALPRRLVLDFRDVFEQGFGFDAITGDLNIAGGVARTNNLRMRGVQAAVLMEGSADIARETQDLRVVVVPEINAGTASLAYAVINPALGIGTFLAQMILRKPIIQAATREFHVTGAWDDPKIVRVERKVGDAAEASTNLLKTP